ncbi:MAG TPA: PASTA domain-containing protein [Actinobacteria bacterium]|nr:PASTA domain-containing protein [Actinomycetota bacterium]
MRGKTRLAPMVMVLLAALMIAGCSKPTVVPDVTGQDVGYATGMLKGSGYEVGTVEEEMADVPAGQVLTQDPIGGTKLAEGETVMLNVAVSPMYSITGTFTLDGFDNIRGSASDCYGTGGYDDITEPVNLFETGG